MAQLSPMMQQYFEIKNSHKDKILLFRLGDFYEMFFDDAILVSKELELTLTGRDCGQSERAPMCGVPYHSADSYIQRLIKLGHKVAICEQTESPKQATGIVKRDVVRIITQGTILENSMLSEDKNNYLASIYIKEDKASIAFTDISCGTILITEIVDQEVNSAIIFELDSFNPSEILFNSEVLTHKPITDYIKNTLKCAVELIDDYVYIPSNAFLKLEKYLKNINEHCSDIENMALAATLHYLEATQKKGLETLNHIEHFNKSQFLILPKETRSNLELFSTMRTGDKKGSLLWVLDDTKTSMGKRLLRRFLEQPLVSKTEIEKRLDAVQQLVEDNISRTLLRDILSLIVDIERICSRIVFKSAMPREIAALQKCAALLPKLQTLIQGMDANNILSVSKGIDPLQDIMLKIESTLSEKADTAVKNEGVIRAGYSKELDELKSLVGDNKTMLAALEAKLRDESGIKTLKIGYNRVFGYYIEVTKSYISEVPSHYIRKQTLVGAERYITEELKTLEEKIIGAGDKISALEDEIYLSLLDFLSGQIDRIQSTAKAIATLDVYCSLAEIAARNNYSKPQVNIGDAIIIKQGRHPVIEQLSGTSFIPNDITLDCAQNRMLIVTGPNMAGKSTYMRQTALIALMVQIGSYVPAAECSVSILSGIFTRVGASDDLAAGQSTFMVEMNELSNILKSADKKSLVILDEIGRGTSTFDGMSIARAVIEHMVNKENLGCKTLFATHYHELTDMENSYDGIKNYSVAVKKRGDEITFLRKIVKGAADDSYGIQVAKLAGIDTAIIERAKEILAELEKHSYLLAGKPKQLDFNEKSEQEIDDEAKKQLLLNKVKNTSLELLSPIEAWQLLEQIQKNLQELS